jgi:DNA-directed RNA polymerase specialized sigma24 family protein
LEKNGFRDPFEGDSDIRYWDGRLYFTHQPMSVVTKGLEDGLDRLAVNDALEKSAAQEKQKAELVKLRYFAGLTIEESARLLGISAPTAKRWWAYSRAWLFHQIQTGGN